MKTHRRNFLGLLAGLVPTGFLIHKANFRPGTSTQRQVKSASRQPCFNITTGSNYGIVKATHLSGNVAYNYKGVWSSVTAYVVGDEVVYEASYWLATAASTNQTPTTRC